MATNTTFRFDSLPSETQDAVQQHVTAIRKNHAKSIKLRIQNGKHCIDIKTLIGHGGWLNWLINDADSGYGSERTAQRDMALADALADRLDDLDDFLDDRTSLSSLFELCRTGADEKALDTALYLMKTGVKINPAHARTLTRIYDQSPALGDMVREGHITIDQAAKLAPTLQEVAPAVQSLAIEHCVQSPEVVRGLAAIHARQPEHFREIIASGTVYNPLVEKQIPLAKASEGDVEASVRIEEAEREARRQQHITDWRNSRSPSIVELEGERDFILKQLAAKLPDGKVRVYVYAADEPEAVYVS